MLRSQDNPALIANYDQSNQLVVCLIGVLWKADRTLLVQLAIFRE